MHKILVCDGKMRLIIKNCICKQRNVYIFPQHRSESGQNISLPGVNSTSPRHPHAGQVGSQITLSCLASDSGMALPDLHACPT